MKLARLFNERTKTLFFLFKIAVSSSTATVNNSSALLILLAYTAN